MWPGVFIIAIVLCLQFIGDGLRDAFDPRQRRTPKRKDLEERSRRANRPVGAGQQVHIMGDRPDDLNSIGVSFMTMVTTASAASTTPAAIVVR